MATQNRTTDKEHVLPVKLPGHSYDIQLGAGLLGNLGVILRRRYAFSRVFLLTDDHVWPLYGERVEASLREAGFGCGVYVIPGGEGSKSLAMAENVYGAMVAANITRKDALIALGGGVVGDLGGFAAATFLRGIPYIQVPTTLLAQVDSSVGGKVAVDLPQGKNLVGSFHQPSFVLVDTDTLKTLSDRVWSDGMGEVIKYGCIGDKALFDRLALAHGRGGIMEHVEDVISACLAIKIALVERDVYDRGERMLLNFGHTLGHAIEAAQGFKGLTHGEAVAVGMVLMARFGETIGFTEAGTWQQIAACAIRHGLPQEVKGIAGSDVLPLVARDKKNFGKSLTLVLLRRIGEGALYSASPEALSEVESWIG